MAKLFQLNSRELCKNPYRADQIIKMLIRGRIQSSQECLEVHQSQKSAFKPIYKIKEFQNLFPNSSQEQWTLLKKHKNQFIQSGPYSQKGLQHFLKEGWISDQDFVWKEGWDSWTRLSICLEFHTRVDATVEDLMDQLSERYAPSSEVGVTYYEPPKYPDWSQWKR